MDYKFQEYIEKKETEFKGVKSKGTDLIRISDANNYFNSYKKKLSIGVVGCSLNNKQTPTFEEYLKLCYIKLNQNYRSKETLLNYSLEEIEQRYDWMKKL